MVVNLTSPIFNFFKFQRLLLLGKVSVSGNHQRLTAYCVQVLNLVFFHRVCSSLYEPGSGTTKEKIGSSVLL